MTIGWSSFDGNAFGFFDVFSDLTVDEFGIEIGAEEFRRDFTVLEEALECTEKRCS